jgi:hypothetical protein
MTLRTLFIILIITYIFPLIGVSQCLETTFLSQVGVFESGGNNRGPQVNEYLKSANSKPGNAWCASFVYWVYKQCDSTFKLNSPAWSPSWFNKKYTIYTRGVDKDIKAQSGDVVGYYYQEKNRIAHVGFFYRKTDKYIITVEGNTNEGGSRDGDGVFKKLRPYRTIYKISSYKK